jgi:hypothetical protein
MAKLYLQSAHVTRKYLIEHIDKFISTSFGQGLNTRGDTLAERFYEMFLLIMKHTDMFHIFMLYML